MSLVLAEDAAPRAFVDAPPLFQRRAIALTCALGELALFDARFTVWVWNRHFLTADGSPAHPAATLTGFLSSEMRRHPGDGLAFPSYPTAASLPALAWQDGHLRFVPATYRRFIVDLSGSFDEYQKRFSSKTRFTLRKKIRKFTELSGGALEWKVYRRPEDIDELFRHARHVSSRTYQEKLLDAGLPDSPEFVAQAKTLAEADSLRGYVLFSCGRPVAYVFCPAVDGAVIYQYVGYDPDFREQSPGTVLQYLLLESLFAEKKFAVFDFTEGEGTHKELFATRSVSCADLYFIRPTVRNTILVMLHLAMSRLSKGIVSLLKKLNLHRRVKALIRFGWT